MIKKGVSNPLLSICVPTYKQPDRLGKLLESISKQFNNRIELIICDDNLDETTKKVVQNYQKLIPIKYIHRKSKGIDTALLELLQAASGDFVWWVGDDVFLPNAIADVLRIIDSYQEIVFLWVNSIDESDPSRLTFPIRGLKIFEDRNQLIEYDVGLLGFITATIFKRAAVISSIPESQKVIGSSFFSLYIILTAISSRGVCALLGEPCFESLPKPSGEVRWYDQLSVFGVNLYKILLKFSYLFNKKKFKAAISRNLRRVLRAVLLERALGYNTGFGSNTLSITEFFKCYYAYKVFWMYLPLLFLPRICLSLAYKIFLRFKFN